MKQWIVWIFALFVLLCFITPLVSDETKLIDNEMEIFQVPFGYFKLPVPKDWYFLSVDQLRERQYMFCPNEISLDLLMEGVNLEALLIIKILTMDVEESDTPTEELMMNDIDYRISEYKKRGTELTGELIGPKEVEGIDGYSASLTQFREKEFLFLGKKEHLLYEIHYSFDIDKETLFMPIFNEMLAGLNSLDYKFDGELKTFEDKGKNFSVLLPADWNVKERDDGKVAQMFVSREEIEKETDVFKVGVTCTKIRRFSKSYPQYSLESDKDIVNLWATGILEVSEEIPNKVLEIVYVEINEKYGILWQRSFKPKETDYYIQEYHVILAKNDILFDVIFEAPVMEFEIYEDAFLTAVGNLKLN